MRRPYQEIKVLGLQDRRTSDRVKAPWVVRWKLDGRLRSKSFRTRSEADRYRSLLLQAVSAGDRFDDVTGEPESWQPSTAVEITMYTWARRWLSEQWIEWAPRTRRSAIESLAKLVMLTVDTKVGRRDVELRRFLTDALPPGSEPGDGHWEQWLAQHSILVSNLDREVVGELDRQLGLRLDGQPLAATTANRTRIVARACVVAAVAAGLTPGDPWPPRAHTRARRKVARRRRSVDLRKLPDPATMAKAIDAIACHQKGSQTYRVMTGVAYYAGMRPSEVVMLRVGALELPPDGWGRIHVVEADISFDEPGEPKTGPRVVPIPSVLVTMLRKWLTDNALVQPEALLFRTSGGKRPQQSNWIRSWHRALISIGQPTLRVYDCRHAAATTWLRSGLPLGETARRLGHSVETLVSTYVGALENEESVGNTKIDRFLSGESDE